MFNLGGFNEESEELLMFKVGICG